MIGAKMVYSKFRDKQKEIFLLAILFVIHIVFTSLYRPFAYSYYTEIAGYSLINIYPSISCIPMLYLFIKIISQKTKFDNAKIKLLLLVSVMVGSYIYE